MREEEECLSRPERERRRRMMESSVELRLADHHYHSDAELGQRGGSEAE